MNYGVKAKMALESEETNKCHVGCPQINACRGKTVTNQHLRNVQCHVLEAKHLIEGGPIHVDSGANGENKSERRYVVKPLQQKNCGLENPRHEILTFVLCGLCSSERETPQVTSTHLDILLSTLFFSSKALMVTGRVAELEAVPNAVTIALPMLAMNLEDGNGF